MYRLPPPYKYSIQNEKSKVLVRETINIINLPHRKQRKSSLIDHLYDYGISNYVFWDGVFAPQQMPFISISQAHKKIVQDAKQRNLDHVIIAEDDLRFSSPNSMKYFIDNKPQSFDLFFGMVYTGNIQDGRITHGFSGMQFYMVHSRFYDRFLQSPNTKHIDVWLGEQCHKYEFYCCEPFICFGQSGHSDNFNRQWLFDESKLPYPFQL